MKPTKGKNSPIQRKIRTTRSGKHTISRKLKPAIISNSSSRMANRDARKVKAALEKLEKAQARLTSSGINLLSMAHDLRRTAEVSLTDSLVQSLAADRILQDLLRLRQVMPSGIQDDLRLLPEAVLNWLMRNFELSQYLEQGQELEIPAERLKDFEVSEIAAPYAAMPLARIRVESPGWKHRKRIVVRPRAIVLKNPDHT
jgi:hypothetical protein